jgi:bifunctional non-homologous end joining protein LigD
LYPEPGITKQDLARFYESIADWILPHIVDRPLSIVRCPKGAQSKCFYQKHLTDHLPEHLHGVEVKEQKKTEMYVSVRDLAGLISLVQIGVLEIHPWGARSDRLERPDRIIWDLDPGDGVEWTDVLTAARAIRDELSTRGLDSFVRTSGGKGLHVVVAIQRRSSWDEVKVFARQVAETLIAREPEKYLATASKARRKGKIFIDYFRNSRGATAVASYSTRAKPTAAIATPVRWDELTPSLAPDYYNVMNLRSRLEHLAEDPWAGFFEKAYRL